MDNNILWETGVKNRIQQKQDEFMQMLDCVVPSGNETAIEIGSCYGGSTVILSYTFRRLICCDKDKQYDDTIIHQDCRFRFVKGDTAQHGTQKSVELILGGDKADFLFIDGNHTYDGVKKDFLFYHRFVKVGGIIAFHDIVESPYHAQAGCFVSKFWKEIKKNYKCKEIIYPPLEWGGIGILWT